MFHLIPYKSFTKVESTVAPRVSRFLMIAGDYFLIDGKAVLIW